MFINLFEWQIATINFNYLYQVLIAKYFLGVLSNGCLFYSIDSSYLKYFIQLLIKYHLVFHWYIQNYLRMIQPKYNYFLRVKIYFFFLIYANVFIPILYHYYKKWNYHFMCLFIYKNLIIQVYQIIFNHYYFNSNWL